LRAICGDEEGVMTCFFFMDVMENTSMAGELLLFFFFCCLTPPSLTTFAFCNVS
jgi:hypothetical protein